MTLTKTQKILRQLKKQENQTEPSSGLQNSAEEFI